MIGTVWTVKDRTCSWNVRFEDCISACKPLNIGISGVLRAETYWRSTRFFQVAVAAATMTK